MPEVHFRSFSSRIRHKPALGAAGTWETGGL